MIALFTHYPCLVPLLFGFAFVTIAGTIGLIRKL